MHCGNAAWHHRHPRRRYLICNNLLRSYRSSQLSMYYVGTARHFKMKLLKAKF